MASSSEEGVISPKVFIISMFRDEADTWFNRKDLDLSRKIDLLGLSPVYRHIRSTPDGEVCQLTTGESLTNAALALSALIFSPKFDLRRTYFLIAGIAGVNPAHGTLGTVAFARFAVQIDLQYEFDAREIPGSWATGYVPQGAAAPGEYPSMIYGTEVFELSTALRDRALAWAASSGDSGGSGSSGGELADSDEAREYRQKFAGDAYAAARAPPSVMAGDVASSNVFFHGRLLAESCAAFMRLLTTPTSGGGGGGGGGAEYVMTAQEDTATLAALLRAALAGRVDFARIAILRTGSNFDRGADETAGPPGVPLHTGHGGFGPAIENIYRAGIRVVRGILDEWDATMEKGLEPGNYIGDIFGSLGGNPPYGPGRKKLLDEIEREEKATA